MKVFLVLFGALLLTANVVAQQSPESVAALVNQPTNDSVYRIGPGDVLDIRVYNKPQLARDAVRVEGNGMIRMPLIDTDIQAACKTESELAKDISTQYARYYKNLHVDVFIKEYHSKQVAIIGAVNDQSRFELQRRVRLLELLTYARGTSPKAGQTINIVHAPAVAGCQKPGESADEAGFSSYRLSETLQGDPRANPYIE